MNVGVSTDLIDHVGRIEEELVSLRDKLPILFHDFTDTFSKLLDRKIILPPPDRGSLQVALGSNIETVNETTDAESPDIFVDDSFQEDFFKFPHARGGSKRIDSYR